MAVKKIGALITLDGEKEFKQSVTNCNKSLTSLKSEMNLVKAQSEGQANSLESLQKKHDVLSKILDEHKKKENELKKALDHSRESYDKVSAGMAVLVKNQEEHKQKVNSLKTEYKAATERLDKMVSSGNASERSMKKQEAVVNALAKELQEEKDALNEVDKAMSRGEKNIQTSANRIKDWETKLNTAQAQTIKATRALNENAAYMREAEQAADKCAKSIDAYGREVKEAEEVTVDFGTVVKSNLGNTLVNIIKDSVSEAVRSVTGLETAQRQLQASTGATTAEMHQYKTVMNELHNENYGDDIGDVAESMALVRQYTNELDAGKIKEMTENGIAMRDVFGMDLSETIRGVDSLVTNMGLSAEEAFDLMAKGAQNGLNKSGELADNIAEYGQLWSQAGFSAEEMFAILDNGLKNGAYNLDKVNDFVKEFGISLTDGRIETSLESFSSETQDLFYEWKAGKATTRDVFYSVIHDLANATDKQKALTLASNTWSALGEDNAMAVIASLGDVNTAYDDVKGTMESIKDIKYDTLESRFQTLGKRFQTEVGVPIAEKALPMMEKGLDAVIDNMDILIPLISGIAAGAVAYKAATEAVALFSTATALATEKQTLFNAVRMADPAVLVTTALVAAGTALLVYADNAREASEEVQMLTEMNDNIVDSANEVTNSVNNTIQSYAESTAQMQAQGEYARTLAERIGTLSEKENKNSAETSVLKGYIAELNSIVPDLNLSYDEQADKLSQSTDEIYKNIEASEKQIAQQAAQKYAIDLIGKKTELEIESIKLANQEADIREKLNDVTDKAMEMGGGLLYLLSDECAEGDALTESLKENQSAAEENQKAKENLAAEEAAVKQALEGMGISWDVVTESVNAATDAEENAAAAQANVTDTLYASASSIAETYMSVKESVTGALESQMNMFEKFNMGAEISTDTLLKNMQSQIDGVSNWAENISALADRGINENLLQYLADMGPEGANYVAAFAKMSDDELKKASSMWAESLDMKSGVESSVNGAIESITTKLSGGSEKVEKAMKDIGANSIAGLTEKMQQGIPEVKNVGNDVGDAAVDGTAEGAGTHSPSWKTAEIGRNLNLGLIQGVNDTKGQVSAAMQQMMSDILNNVSTGLNAAKFMKDGKSVTTGIAAGINAGKSLVTVSVRNMTAQVQSSVNTNLSSSKFLSAGAKVVSNIAAGLTAGRPLAVSAATTLASGVRKAASQTGSLYVTGYNLSVGMANGIYTGRSSVINAVASVCSAAVNTARNKLQIRSPSRVFAELGQYTAEGFGVGYKEKISQVNRMIEESMDYDKAYLPDRKDIGGSNAGERKIVIELPIYNNGVYSRTEIVEIAREGIANTQRWRSRSKGVVMGV